MEGLENNMKLEVSFLSCKCFMLVFLEKSPIVSGGAHRQAAGPEWAAGPGQGPLHRPQVALELTFVRRFSQRPL